MIKRLVRDLDIPVRIEICDTVREPDGLAMSSRNAHLSPEERERATALRRALLAAGDAVAAGRARPGCGVRPRTLRAEQLPGSSPSTSRSSPPRRSIPWKRSRARSSRSSRHGSGVTRLIDNHRLSTPSRGGKPQTQRETLTHAANDAEVEDPPCDRDRLRPALRRLDHDRPGSARRSGYPGVRAGRRRRREQRRPVRDVHDRRRAWLWRHEGQRRGGATRAPRRHDHRDLLRRLRPRRPRALRPARRPRRRAQRDPDRRRRGGDPAQRRQPPHRGDASRCPQPHGSRSPTASTRRCR